MPRHVLIISPARSGSTSLRLTVNQHRDAICHGEILGRNRILGPSRKVDLTAATPELRAADPEAFLQLMLEQGDFTHSGFKALCGHFFLEQNAVAFHRVLSAKPDVVFLWRRDLVRRYRSELLLRMEKGMWTDRHLSRITVQDIIADARRQMSMAAIVRAQLAGYGIERVMEIDFEDLIGTPDMAARVMTFLGLSADRARLGKDKRTQVNEARRQPVVLPDIFEAPALDDWRDVPRTAVMGHTSGGPKKAVDVPVTG